MKFQRYWIALSLIAAGVTLCQAQTTAATLNCESNTGMLAFELVDYNLPNTPPPPSTPSTGGAISQNGLMQGFVDASVNPSLTPILGSGSSAQIPFVNCWLTPSAPPATWEVILGSVVVTGIQFSSPPAAQGSSAAPPPFVRIALEYSGMSIGFPSGNVPVLAPSPAPSPTPAPVSAPPSGSGSQPSGSGSSPSTGATPAPASGASATPSS